MFTKRPRPPSFGPDGRRLEGGSTGAAAASQKRRKTGGGGVASPADAASSTHPTPTINLTRAPSLGQRRRLDGMARLMARAGKGLSFVLPRKFKPTDGNRDHATGSTRTVSNSPASIASEEGFDRSDAAPRTFATAVEATSSGKRGKAREAPANCNKTYGNESIDGDAPPFDCISTYESASGVGDGRDVGRDPELIDTAPKSNFDDELDQNERAPAVVEEKGTKDDNLHEEDRMHYGVTLAGGRESASGEVSAEISSFEKGIHGDSKAPKLRLGHTPHQSKGVLKKDGVINPKKSAHFVRFAHAVAHVDGSSNKNNTPCSYSGDGQLRYLSLKDMLCVWYQKKDYDRFRAELGRSARAVERSWKMSIVDWYGYNESNEKVGTEVMDKQKAQIQEWAFREDPQAYRGLEAIVSPKQAQLRQALRASLMKKINAVSPRKPHTSADISASWDARAKIARKMTKKSVMMALRMGQADAEVVATNR